MNKVVIISVLIIFVLSGCKKSGNTSPPGSAEEKKFRIEGRLSNGEGKKLYLQEISPARVQILDSVIIDKKDNFKLSSTSKYPGLYLIRTEAGSNIVVCARGGEKINITADYNDLIHYTVSGSEESEQIRLLALKTHESLLRIGELSKISKDSIDSPEYSSIKLKINADFHDILNDLRTYSINFIKDNQTSIITVMALKNEIGPNMHILHPVSDKELFQYTDSVLMSLYPGSELVKSMHNELITYFNKVDAEKAFKDNLTKDKKAPEIALPSPEGKILNLSSLKGKIVLLVFWAAWSPPSRAENPNLVAIYKKFHSKGFEIFQVSLDYDQDAWLQAIKDDSLTWFHVTDLEYWNSKVVSLYGIKRVPANFLLDRNGEIIASDLRGSELNRKLEEIFNK